MPRSSTCCKDGSTRGLGGSTRRVTRGHARIGQDRIVQQDRREAGRLKAGRLEAGLVEAGARDAKVAKVALLTRARAGWRVRIFACAKEERSARGAGRIEVSIMTT